MSLSFGIRTIQDHFENDNIRVVVGLDFGTTHSGFAYCHIEDQDIRSYNSWNGALDSKPVELFRLHLGDSLDEFKPELPVDYKKAITDFLREIGEVIKETVATCWPTIDYFKNVLLVITVPAEFSEKSKEILRMCAFNAGLIKEKYSIYLQFTTEHEAVALYCMKNLGQTLARPETNIMIVDCGDNRVDLTTRKLMTNEQLVGDKPMDLLRDNNYGQMQYLIQNFGKYGKIPFTGDDPGFSYELDIQETIPILTQYITDDEIRKTLENDEWIIEIDFERMKSISEPVIQKILHLIKAQLDNTQETYSAMFLVGSFSESKYLQKRVKEEFQYKVKIISVPEPIAAIARGAVIYGLSMKNMLH
ncbi:hypothetical protein C1645_876068 [Glomus cerebriforme]|uniref:Actin-like ATPase domain-containing protein n=1 Tax=Glomus cerebriforme TaxID=658196 RepID=A0A397SWQ7_9GLOM|nr:hypothetical protein C1645_876068 [Glomus cerebriforme]